LKLKLKTIILKLKRNQEKVDNALKSITSACKTNENLLPKVIYAAKQYCTVGEIVDAMKNEFGEWQENSIF